MCTAGVCCDCLAHCLGHSRRLGCSLSWHPGLCADMCVGMCIDMRSDIWVVKCHSAVTVPPTVQSVHHPLYTVPLCPDFTVSVRAPRRHARLHARRHVRALIDATCPSDTTWVPASPLAEPMARPPIIATRPLLLGMSVANTHGLYTGIAGGMAIVRV